MPWNKASDAKRHTKKADTPEKARQWLHVANSELEKTGDDALAIRAANSVVKNHPARRHGDGAPGSHWSGK